MQASHTSPSINVKADEPSDSGNLYLGVDGGQTATKAVIGDSSDRVLGTGLGGPSNHAKGPEGRTRLIKAVTDAITEACSSAGLASEAVEFDAACLGFTGGIEGNEEILRTILKCRFLIVTDDVTIALAGAHSSHPGIVTIGGTGSVSMGRNANGEVARAGGWGYAFGDEGGAWGIVREALRAALRMDEQWGPPTLLREMLLAATGESDIHILRRRFYTVDYPRPRIAAFSQLVDAAARKGDAVATEILQSAADHLAMLTQVVRKRLFGSADAVNVAYVGGVFQSEIVRAHFTRQLENDSGVRVMRPLHEPSIGALLEAIRSARSKDKRNSPSVDAS